MASKSTTQVQTGYVTPPAFSLRLVREDRPDAAPITSDKDVYPVCKAILEPRPQECVVLVALDTQNTIIGTMIVSIGTINAALFSQREIMQGALMMNATNIIVAHNHPSGDPTPSPEDILATKRLDQACELMGLNLLDHLIIGHNRYRSLKKEGLF